MPALPQYNSHLAKILPFLSDVEMKKLKDEVAAAKKLVVIFDGTTYCGEALALSSFVTSALWLDNSTALGLYVCTCQKSLWIAAGKGTCDVFVDTVSATTSEGHCGS